MRSVELDTNKLSQFFILRSLSSQNRGISEITVTFKYPDFGMIAISNEKLRPLVGVDLERAELLVSSLAPHTSGPRDVPRCGALSLLQKDAALQGGSSKTAVG